MIFIEEIKKRLKMFKYTVSNSQEEIDSIKYFSEMVLDQINNIANQNYSLETLPKPLKYLFIDKVVGGVLNHNRSCGNLSEYDFNPLEKSIQEGDTRIEFNNSKSPEELFDLAVAYLMYGRDKELYRFRRIQW